MPDALTTITKLINSPPGQLVAGGILAGIVWKFFERVESVLNEDTKLEIARWLRLKSFETGLRTDNSANWPGTFLQIFNRVFGERHLSWKCVWRTTVASVFFGFLGALVVVPFIMGWHGDPSLDVFALYEYGPVVLILALTLSVLPDYLSLFETRLILNIMRGSTSFWWPVLMVLDLLFTIGTAIIWSTTFLAIVLQSIQYLVGEPDPEFTLVRSWQFVRIYLFGREFPFGLMFIPSAIFTSIWLWLYAGSGFLLKFARRFDIGFDWFNRKFDIEKKPLQSIGLVAGALLALVYWAVVIVSRIVGRS